MKGVLITILVLSATFFAAKVKSQGSEEVWGGPNMTLNINAGEYSILAETLYIGSGTHYINGTLNIYSKYVVIDPNTTITGTGSIMIYNPSEAGNNASRTYIDGNLGVKSIDVNIILNNASGIELFNKDFPSELVSAGFVNNPTSTTYIGKDLSLAVDGADVWLDADIRGDLQLSVNASISNFSASRMIITNNSIISHLIKEGYSAGFTFPIGISDGDYTPVTINNASASTLYASVKNYGDHSNPVINEPGFGMNRLWHIYSNQNISADLTLYHNQATSSTTGADYIDALAYISQFDGSNWSNVATSDYTGSYGIHRNNSINIKTDPSTTAWFTKSSQPYILPLVLSGFKILSNNCDILLNWTTADEVNFSHFEVEFSNNGNVFTTIGKVDGGKYQYHFNTAQITKDGYYRLKMIDLNGKFTYSNALYTNSICPDININVYPNPTAGLLTISHLNQGSHIALLNSSGQTLMRLISKNTAAETINIGNLPAGIYNLVIRNGKKISTVKVFKQ
ncbi:T9SS type A sorting domain-containing protein [Polluticaenibacter yanchengensis]|uniref:T9SS type A sorting domain-containing protein n=1 Tax=Polluticaenibacter yanchengensis TaxID=3014562 RepID=A0ABT4UGF4_9BACT|nr:T9SS type A sorting domain-containing protein [Chitinophagaceae bacterium LY-5]